MSEVTFTLHHGDCRDVMATLDADSIDAIVCDPPYGLAFMGKAWDHGVPGVEFWAEALRVAKPGAHLCAFGGTRTFHRLACAIEDAGWEIRDTLSWLYGSGFPKSHNGPWGGTALKPAWEPIILARKPLVGTVAANVQLHGTGAVNVDACRVAHVTVDGGNLALNPHLRSHINGGNGGRIIATETERREVIPHAQGRWPANVVLDEDAARALDAQSGTLAAGGHPAHRNTSGYSGGLEQGPTGSARRTDSGGASRFFYCAKASRSEREAGLSGAGSAKASHYGAGLNSATKIRSDAQRDAGVDRGTARNTHPTVKPIALMQWLCRLVTPPNGLILDPFTGSGSTGVAAIREGFRFTGIEKESEYIAIARARIDAAEPKPPTLALDAA